MDELRYQLASGIRINTPWGTIDLLCPYNGAHANAPFARTNMRTRRSSTFQPLAPDRQIALRDLPLASFRARLAAYAIDIFLVCVVCGSIEILLRLPEIRRPGSHVHIEINPFHSWSLIVVALYFGLSTYFGHGQTLGKRLLRIRVVSLTHGHLSLWHSVERALGYGASAVELGFGFFQYFIHPNRQTLHDRIAETIVVAVPRKAAGEPPEIH